MNALMGLMAAATSVEDIQHSYGNLIFIGVFFLLVLIAIIWWLKRSV